MGGQTDGRGGRGGRWEEGGGHDGNREQEHKNGRGSPIHGLSVQFRSPIDRILVIVFVIIVDTIIVVVVIVVVVNVVIFFLVVLGLGLVVVVVVVLVI